MRVVGSAGHVDHGKSSLIRALTGIDPDRLQEEKERGMTIDLGFAWLQLPNGLEVSIVDVPGHERFIHNMLAGIGGIDVALLVIAADEGVMPQTREHVAILDLLDVTNGVVALTKRDLVDQEWLEMVEADVREFLETTTLRDAPIVACSSTTGDGLDDLRAALQTVLSVERRRPSNGQPRLPIDRVFTVAGFGTVVTGTLLDGELKLGQELEVQPGGLKARVRGLQSHKKKVDRLEAGTRSAVNIGGLAVDDLRRGQVLTAPGALKPTRAVDARLRVIREARSIRHNAEVTFHTGAAETVARLTLLDSDELRPGDEGWVQLRLQDEVALARGDLFIVRLPSPSMTVGGGSIVETHARRHRRRQPALLHQLEVLAQGSPDEIVLEHLRAREPVEVEALVRRAGLPPDQSRAAVEQLLQTGRARRLDQGNGGGRASIVSTTGWQALRERVESLLAAFHQARPLRRGLSREELRTRLGVDARVFPRIVEALVAEGVVIEDGPFIRLASHSVELRPDQRVEADRIVRTLREAGVSPPDRAEWAAALHASDDVVEALLESGALVEVTPGLVYEGETLARLVEQIRQAIVAEGPRTVAQVRDLLDASRKYALAIVSYMDEQKITRRVGDARVLM